MTAFHQPAHLTKGGAVLVVWLLALLPLSLAVPADAQDSAPPTEQTTAQNPREDCSAPSDDFKLLCTAFTLATENFVNPVNVADLAAAALRGVQNANLPGGRPANSHPPTCHLPSPEFESVCVAIDRTQNTTRAALAATDELLASLGDARTRRLDPPTYQRFDRSLAEHLTRQGIGVEYAIQGETCTTPGPSCPVVITQVYPNSPAETAGLQVGDTIVEWGQPVANLPCSTLQQLELSRNAVNPAVIKINRNGTTLDFTINRTTVVEPVNSSHLVDNSIGYLRLDRFTRASQLAFEENLNKLIGLGAKSLVLDLRSNPGGFVVESQVISEYFLKRGDYVTGTESEHFNEQTIAPTNGVASNAIDLPMAVAVNGRTASASEIVVLALRGNERAQVVGSTTYGKSTGQQLVPVRADDGTLLGGIQVTAIRIIGPNRSSAQGGIEPDLEVDFFNCAHPVDVSRQAVEALYPKVSTITLASSPFGASYLIGEAVTAKVTFDAPVEVNTLGGIPRLNLQVGDEVRPAIYVSTTTDDDTSVVEFTYVVGIDNDSDGISIAANSIDLNGATIRRIGTGWNAVLDHSSLADDVEHRVGVGPFDTTQVPDPSLPPGLIPDLPPLPTNPDGDTDSGDDTGTNTDTDPNANPLPGPFPDIDIPQIQGFLDIAQTSFTNAINWLAAQGITTGCSPTTFCPEQFVTRGQMAAFLTRALQLPEATQNYFTDTTDSTFQDHINRLREAGITTGCSQTLYCPDQLVTRGQMAVFLTRALQLPQASQDFFTDTTGHNFQDQINRLRESEITTGCTATTFCPDQTITRGQMAAFLFRARELIDKLLPQLP